MNNVPKRTVRAREIEHQKRLDEANANVKVSARTAHWFLRHRRAAEARRLKRG